MKVVKNGDKWEQVHEHIFQPHITQYLTLWTEGDGEEYRLSRVDTASHAKICAYICLEPREGKVCGQIYEVQ